MTPVLLHGIDFTSAPSRAKPITCVTARLEGTSLTLTALQRWDSFRPFEALLAAPGPWLAALDFPFSFARPFLHRIGWPTDWRALAAHLAALEKPAYLAAHEAFRAAQPAGQKHLPRALDRLTGGAAPNNIVNPPVGRMLYEGVRRLHAAGVALPGLASGDPARRAVEGYPAVAARTLIGTTAYKDGPEADRSRRRALRRTLLDRLAAPNPYGLTLQAAPGLPDLTADPRGDDLDAALCALQAAWAVRAGLAETDGPPGIDPAEGWIADPVALGHPVARAAAPPPPAPPRAPDTPPEVPPGARP